MSRYRQRVLGGVAVLAATFVGVASPAWAGVGVNVTPMLPTSVTVGQTALPASLQVVNSSTPPESAGNVTITSLNLVPACGTTGSTGTGDCPAANADPGVFSVSPNATGEAGTACAGQTFLTSIIDPSTGQVGFTPTVGLLVLHPPATPGSVCRIHFTVSVLKEPTKNAGSAGANSVQTAQIGFAQGMSAVNGSSGSGSGSSLVTVTKAQPGITTAATASGTVGAAISDTATLSAASSPAPPPGGTITFTLFGPNNATCTGTPSFTSPVTVASGGGNYTSAAFTPTSPGTYRWVAAYSGDANNAGAKSACGDAGETSTILVATPTIVTTASGAGTVGLAIHDLATLSGAFNPTGTITFTLFGPGNTTCSGTPIFTSIKAVAGNGSYQSGSFTTTAVGTYRFVAVYSGDASNTAVASPCGDLHESVAVSPKTGPPPAPVISFAKQSSSRWREGKSLPHISSSKPPVGTTFSFKLNETAAVTFSFTKAGGRKVGGRCVTETKKNRHDPSCSLVAGTLSFTGHSATNRVSFDGRISRTHTLIPGNYTLVITAINHARAHAKPRQLSFTIVK